MIKRESYKTNWIIDRVDGDLTMECTVSSNGDKAVATYTGRDFVTGLNSIIGTLNQKLDAADKAKLTPEQKRIVELEKAMKELRTENLELRSKISSNKQSMSWEDAYAQAANWLEKYFTDAAKDQESKKTTPKTKADQDTIDFLNNLFKY